MAQAVSSRYSTAEALVQSQDSPWGILWWAKWHWDMLLFQHLYFPLLTYHSTQLSFFHRHYIILILESAVK
jgi:hypothetical protein